MLPVSVRADATPITSTALTIFMLSLVYAGAVAQTGITNIGSVPLGFLKKVYDANNWVLNDQAKANFQALQDRINAQKIYGNDYNFVPSDFTDIGITNMATSINKVYENHLLISDFTSTILNSPGQIAFDNNIGSANMTAFRAANVPYRLSWRTYDVYSSPDNLPNWCLPDELASIDTYTRNSLYSNPAVCTKFKLSLFRNNTWLNYSAWRINAFCYSQTYVKFIISSNSLDFDLYTSRASNKSTDLIYYSSHSNSVNPYTAWNDAKIRIPSSPLWSNLPAVTGFTAANIFDEEGTGYLEYVPSLIQGKLPTSTGTGAIAIPGGQVFPKDWTLPSDDTGLVALPTIVPGAGTISVPLPIPAPKAQDTTGDTTDNPSVAVPIDPSISIPDARDNIIKKIKLPGFDKTIDRIKSMDTSRGDPPKVTFNLNAIFNAATSHFGVPQSPFSSGETTLIDFGMLQNYSFLGLPLIDYFRSIVSMGFILRTFFYVWRKITPNEVIS